jgi:hypothetical protein
MKIKAARKWIDEQSHGSRSGAGSGNVGEKRRKVVLKDLSNASTSQNRPRSHAKVVNMSIVHGPRDLAKDPEDTAFTFPYQPLDASKSEIRIINLKPGTASSPLQCALQHVPTANKSRASYKALSYTWGAPEPTKILLLDGIQIQVRENLWQALYHIRQQNATLQLWVDALCINQEDIPERNEQVSRMGTLYNQAEEVIVWLGPEKDGSDVAISFIRHSVTPRSRALALDLSSDLPSSIELRPIVDLLSREYWRRVWIVQEVFRARKIMIYCGHEKLPWKDLAKFFRQVRRLPDNNAQQIATSSEEINTLSHNAATTLIDHRTARLQNLETLLMSYDGSFCCDPRDKVYALVGLAGKRLTNRSAKLVEQDWLTIDYTRSPRDLFQVLTLMYLAEVGDGFLVRWMQMLQRILDLPAPWTTSPTPVPPNSLGKVACKTPLPGRVSSVGPEFTWYPDIKKPLKVGHRRSKHSSSAPDFVPLFKWYSQFLGPRIPSPSRFEGALLNLSEDDIARLESFNHVEWLTKSPLPRQSLSGEAVGPGPRSTKIRPFTTHTGRVGLTSCDIKDTDEIIRFYGSDVAWVVPGFQRIPIEPVDRQIKGRALILASDTTVRRPDFLTSFSAKFKWAVPSSLDEGDTLGDHFDQQLARLGLWGLDTTPPDPAYQKEIERFEEARDGTNGNGNFRYWGRTTREWEFWTW